MSTLRRAALAAILASIGFAQTIVLPGQSTPVSLTWLYNNKMRWAGAWSSTATYNPQDVVGYSGQTYVSLAAGNLNNTPVVGVWWAQISPPVFPSGSQTQYLRLQPNTLSPVYQFANLPTISSADYNFPAQTPGGSLLALGVNQTVNLAPCPLGVNGTDAGHNLYLSAGTGTAEATPITGGTCTSGAASGTVTLTPANAHSGAWTIGSAWAGVQEAAVAACATGSMRVQIPGATYTAYGTLSIPCSGLSIRGFGGNETATWIDMASGFTGRAVQAIVGALDFGDMTISYTTAGTGNEALYVKGMGDGLVSNLTVLDSYNGITSWNSARVLYRDNVLFPENNGYTFGSDSGQNTTPYVQGGVVNPIGSGNSMVLDSNIVGGIILDVGMSSGAAEIATVCGAVSGGVINEMAIVGNILDQYSAVGIDLEPGSGCTMNRWQIIGNKLAGAAANTLGIKVNSPAAPGVAGLDILDNLIGSSSASSTTMILAGAQGVKIEGNTIYNGGSAGGTGIYLVGAANANIDIRSNNIGSDGAWSGNANEAYAVYVDNHAHSGITISGNTLAGSAAAISNNSTTANGVIWSSNRGVDDVVPAVASATALAFPINPTFTLTGTAAPTSVTVSNGIGSKFTFVATAGSPGIWTAGATIGNTFTPTQNVPVNCYWDGTKVWCK